MLWQSQERSMYLLVNLPKNHVNLSFFEYQSIYLSFDSVIDRSSTVLVSTSLCLIILSSGQFTIYNPTVLSRAVSLFQSTYCMCEASFQFDWVYVCRSAFIYFLSVCPSLCLSLYLFFIPFWINPCCPEVIIKSCFQSQLFRWSSLLLDLVRGACTWRDMRTDHVAQHWCCLHKSSRVSSEKSHSSQGFTYHGSGACVTVWTPLSWNPWNPCESWGLHLELPLESIERHLVPDTSRWQRMPWEQCVNSSRLRWKVLPGRMRNCRMSWHRADGKQRTSLRHSDRKSEDLHSVGRKWRGSEWTRDCWWSQVTSWVHRKLGETGALCSRGTLLQRYHVCRSWWMMLRGRERQSRMSRGGRKRTGHRRHSSIGWCSWSARVQLSTSCFWRVTARASRLGDSWQRSSSRRWEHVVQDIMSFSRQGDMTENNSLPGNAR